MSFWVYILKCNDNSYYTGHTDNIENRIAQHRAGRIGGYTATRLPVTLVFSEQFSTRLEALALERQIKRWSRKKKEAMMREDWSEVSRLARSHANDSSPRPAHGSTSSPRTVEKVTVRPEPVEGQGKKEKQE
jgi:predicted GIY-YIG superfamily endonuclease